MSGYEVALGTEMKHPMIALIPMPPEYLQDLGHDVPTEIPLGLGHHLR
jgi:hypothetical protein